MATEYQIKQFIRTVDKGWLEVITTDTCERTALHNFAMLCEEHPNEHFELIRRGVNETCLRHTPGNKEANHG